MSNTDPAHGAKRLLILSIFLILAGGLLANLIETAGHTIKIKDLRFAGSDGRVTSALLYIPPGVSKKNPAPGIVATHGYINTRETQDGFAIEFARRGYVVLAPDEPGHGYSDPPAFAGGFGGADTLKYFRTLDIVDPNNIGLEGHSMGGWATVVAAATNPGGYRSVVLEGSSTGTFGIPEGTATFPRNLCLVFSLYDEFSKLMWGPVIPRNIVNTEKLKKLFGTTETVQVGKIYGSIADGTARVLYQPPNIHPRDHFSTTAIGYAIDWMQKTLKGGKDIPSSDQIWYWKELGNFIALIGMVLLLFAVGGVLLRFPYFKELNEAPPERKSLSGIGWWVGAILAVLIPLPLYLWAIGYGAPGKLTPSALFSQINTTVIMMWALAVAVISIVLFLLWHFLSARRKGATFVNYGVTWPSEGVNWRKVGKSFVLALVIVVTAYLTLIFSDWAFQSDYRIWVFAVRPMTWLQFRIFLGYLIPIAFYFLVVAMILHGQLRRRGRDGAELGLGKEMVINILLLITGYVILEVIQYAPSFAGGSLAIPDAALWGIIMFQFFPIFAIVALLLTYFFRRTGHVYTGAFVSALLVTWILVAGTATHYAF